MENVDDDDFGDLYADVEVQASSAINAQSTTPKLQAEVNKIDCNEVQEEECESESEDDFNILLNDDNEDYNDIINEDEVEENAQGNGSGQNSNGSGEGKSDYKYTRPPQATYSSHFKDNGSSCIYSYSAPLVKGNWEDCGYMQRTGSASAVQNGRNFSLPWSRNILDVNIDIFEKKPWRYPGADLTDYFNFGFDEASWKQYCNSLDRHREQIKREVKDSDYKTSKDIKPNGRVIEVEESIIERQPSTTMVRSHDRDSGVVIQIALKDSIEDPVNSPKEHCKASENGDVGEDGRDLFLSSASEDELPSLEGTGGGSASFTYRRNTPVRECVSMDSDYCEKHEFSDRTLGEIESSDDANKSSERDIADPGTFVRSRDKLHGEGQEHSRGSSCSRSHVEASGDEAFLDFEKSHDHHIRVRNLESELQEKGTIDYQPREVPETRQIRTKSVDSKYFTRGTRFLNRDEDSGKSDARILYERSNSTLVQHRKSDRRHAIDSHERDDTSHFKEAEPFYSSSGRFSDYTCRIPYSKNSEKECQLKRRYDKNWYGSRNAKAKHDDPLELSDDELSERDRSRFVSFHESEHLIDEYIPYLDGEKASQQRRRVDQRRNNKRMRTEDLVTKCKYIYNVMEETDSRRRPYNRDTNILEDYYHVNLTYFRRETKSPSRGERRDSSPCNSLNDVHCMDLNDEEGRFDPYQPSSFHLHREPFTASRRWQSPTVPRGRHQIFSGSVSADQTIRYPGDRDNFERGRGYWQSEGLKWVEDENNPVYQQNILNAERISCSFGRTSSDRRFESFDYKGRPGLVNERTSSDRRFESFGYKHGPGLVNERTSSDRRFDSFDYKHGPGLVGKFLDDSHMDQEKYKLMQEGNNASKFGQGSKFYHKDNHWRRSSRWRDPIDSGFVVENRESSRRYSEAGGATYFDRYSHLDLEPKAIEGIKRPHFRNTLRTRNPTTDPYKNDKERLDILSSAQQEESLDIEEGQIISEEMNEKIVKRRRACFGKLQICEVKNSANDKNMVLEGQDNPRILEIMAKMEKRRERFKQPIALKTASDNVSKPSIDLPACMTEAMQPRPARKRRWVSTEAI